MPAVILQHNPFVSETRRELRMLRHFVVATEYGLRAARDADHAAIGGLFNEYGKDAELMILSHGSYHAEVHHIDIPRALRYTQVTSIFFTLENRLVKICDHLFVRKKNLSKTISEITDRSPFKACRKYLTQVIDAKVTVWEHLELARLVRNCIGHSNGFPSGLTHGEKALRDGISRTASLELTSDDRLIVRSDYICDLLEVASTLLDEICSNLDLGDESPLDYCGIPDTFGIGIDSVRKKWKVLGGKNADLPGTSVGSKKTSKKIL